MLHALLCPKPSFMLACRISTPSRPTNSRRNTAVSTHAIAAGVKMNIASDITELIGESMYGRFLVSKQ